jgi:hypothetical protein
MGIKSRQDSLGEHHLNTGAAASAVATSDPASMEALVNAFLLTKISRHRKAKRFSMNTMASSDSRPPAK